jgi:hypothetical protein
VAIGVGAGIGVATLVDRHTPASSQTAAPSLPTSPTDTATTADEKTCALLKAGYESAATAIAMNIGLL